jgi:small redox-active disulfide protein 2
MTIQILGTGCPKCRQTEENARQALQQLGLQAEVVHVTKPTEIAKFKVMFTPALAIDGTVKCSGKIPSVDEIKGWLTTGR